MGDEVDCFLQDDVMAESLGSSWGWHGRSSGRFGGSTIGRYVTWLIAEWITGWISCGSTIGRYLMRMVVAWLAGW